jgi:cellulose synthase/poly-beta-1,6-N-acetylglucosamine synthase-like glycosyltransferase
VRVLIPCYKESLGTVSATISAALEADLPPGVTRELYLCDDGKDAEKRAWLEQHYGRGHRGQVHYVTGRCAYGLWGTAAGGPSCLLLLPLRGVASFVP